MRSLALYCPRCSALYEAHFDAPDPGRLSCEFCDSELLEIAWPAETAPEDVGTGVMLRCIQGPLGERAESPLRVWLDDDREDRAARPGWTQVTTAAEAIELLRTGTVFELSLDHDLGDDERHGRGIDVVDFLVSEQEERGRPLWPRGGITLHTANPYGRDAMARAIRRYAPRAMHVKEGLDPGGKRTFRFWPRQEEERS
ncbi:MAG: cyclic-phosphate processing receiver domain-containing protein [Solirubrobacterales bacterium]